MCLFKLIIIRMHNMFIYQHVAQNKPLNFTGMVNTMNNELMIITMLKTDMIHVIVCVKFHAADDDSEW